MDWTSALAVLATVTAFICQFVGIPICYQIIKSQDTCDVSPVPFITFFVSNAVWLEYGFLIADTSVILTSGQGAILQFLYICVYYFYSTRKFALHGMLLIGFMSVAVPIIYVTNLEDDAGVAKYNIGLYCCVLAVAVCASPLATVSEVVKHRSTRSMSLPLCVINFLSSVLWVLYGLAISDQFLTIPNGLGAILGLVQFFLFYLYGCKEKSFQTAESAREQLQRVHDKV